MLRQQRPEKLSTLEPYCVHSYCNTVSFYFERRTFRGASTLKRDTSFQLTPTVLHRHLLNFRRPESLYPPKFPLPLFFADYTHHARTYLSTRSLERFTLRNRLPL